VCVCVFIFIEHGVNDRRMRSVCFSAIALCHVSDKLTIASKQCAQN